MMPHHGGRNPLRADERCFVRFRNGRQPDYALRSGAWRWEWSGKFPQDFDFDIVGYRVEASA